MSWFDPTAISLFRLLEQYPEKTIEELETIYVERRDTLQMRYEMDWNYFKMMKETKQNFPIIDSPDESFHFLIEHPQEAKGFLYNRIERVPLTPVIKKKVFEKCESQCVTCGRTHDLQIHHIDGDPSNFRLDNLELLCYRCHKKLHKIQGHTRRKPRKQK
jgi:HNH endonuclease